jgi:hypothetical protein
MLFLEKREVEIHSRVISARIRPGLSELLEAPMTEVEWLNEKHNSQAMVWSLRGTTLTRTKGGKRKLRLFACASCRLTWDLLTDPLLRQAVEVAERFAEGQAGKDELQKAYESARGRERLPSAAPDHRQSTASWMAEKAAHPRAFDAAFYMTASPLPLTGGSGAQEQERDAALCELLRCIFGNPYRPARIAPDWLQWNGGCIRGIATAIYDERDFDRMPVLADALEEAGCAEQAIIGHLRVPTIHARGCWVLDQLLGRA